MAKKKTTKKTPADKTTTYSTRLNDEQREHLEQAAGLKGVSASRFIRDATLRAAADAVNATAPNDRAITAIAQRLANSLVDQQAKLKFVDEFDQATHSKVSLNNGHLAMAQTNQNDESQPERTLSSIEINTLTTQEIRQLKSIAESCPIAFAQAFLKAMTGANEPLPEFTVRSKPDQLVAD